MSNFQSYINKLAADMPPEFLANMKKKEEEGKDKGKDSKEEMCPECENAKGKCTCKKEGGNSKCAALEEQAYIQGYNTVLKVAFCL